MELKYRSESIAELKSKNSKLTALVVVQGFAVLMALMVIAAQSKIVVLQTPGMPNETVIEKTQIDRGAQRAVLVAVTANMASINPANAEYQKAFVQSFLSPTAYTKVSADIDAHVARLASQRELGSYYFVFRDYQYDDKINKHFVIGEVHTVNAAHDTGQPFVFEYSMHVENYRPVVDDVVTYPGDKPHNSVWIGANAK